MKSVMRSEKEWGRRDGVKGKEIGKIKGELREVGCGSCWGRQGWTMIEVANV